MLKEKYVINYLTTILKTELTFLLVYIDNSNITENRNILNYNTQSIADLLLRATNISSVKYLMKKYVQNIRRETFGKRIKS